MVSLISNILVEEPAGLEGENLEFCISLQWPGPSNIDALYVRQLISRLLSASYRPPELLGAFALNSNTLLKILRHGVLILSHEPNIIDVVVPDDGCVHVFGDLHGDVHSLANALSQAGLPSSTNCFVFAGDYVDRGPWGVEVLLIVLVLKFWQPNYVHILRGNHETTGCIQRYGFAKEVEYKYSAKMLPLFTNIFRQLPLAAVIRTLSANAENEGIKGESSQQSLAKKNVKRVTRSSKKQSARQQQMYPWAGPLSLGERRVVVMHGGLFRSDEGRKEGRNDIARLTELMEISRCYDDPYENAIEDLLWSDPQACYNGIAQNTLRGAGILFGETTVDFFLRDNHLHGIIRAHEGPDMREKRPDMQDMQKGFSLDMDLPSGFVATVFSAANYLSRGNHASFATLYGKCHKDSSLMPRFTTFDRFSPPSDVHSFYESTDICCTPRQSIS